MKARLARVRNFVFAASLGALVAGCAPGPTIHVDHQPGTNFSAFKTFTMGTENSGGENPLAEQRIRRAISAQLGAKGLTPAQADSADLWVYVHVRLRVDTKVDVWNTGWGYGYYGWGGHGHSYVDVRNVPMGTLVVDLVDHAKNEAVWRGVAEGTVHQDASPQESEALINGAVEKLFRDYPPKS